LQLRARDALVAGVANPPGVLPAGARLRPGNTLMSPDGEWTLGFEDSSRRIRLKKGNDVRWSGSTAGFSSAAVSRDGRLLLIRGSATEDQQLVSVLGQPSPRPSDEAYLFVQDGLMSVRYQSDQKPERGWYLNADGKCFDRAGQFQCLILPVSSRGWERLLPEKDRPGAIGPDPANVPESQ